MRHVGRDTKAQELVHIVRIVDGQNGVRSGLRLLVCDRGRTSRADCQVGDIKQVLSRKKGSATNCRMVVHKERPDLGSRKTADKVRAQRDME